MDDVISSKIKNILASKLYIDSICISFSHKTNTSLLSLRYNLPGHTNKTKNISLKNIDEVFNILNFDLIFNDDKSYINNLNQFSWELKLNCAPEKESSSILFIIKDDNIDDKFSFLNGFNSINSNMRYRKIISCKDFSTIISYFIDSDKKEIYISWISPMDLLGYKDLVAVHFDWIYPKIEVWSTVSSYIRVALIRLDSNPSVNIVSALELRKSHV